MIVASSTHRAEHGDIHSHESALKTWIQDHGLGNLSSIETLGSGIHAVGYRINRDQQEEQTSGALAPLFLRKISDKECGHDLPGDRAKAMLEAAHGNQGELPVHAVFGITQDSQLIELTKLVEVLTLSDHLPENVVNLGLIMRDVTPTQESEKQHREIVRDLGLSMADLIAQIHNEPYNGPEENRPSLYKRAMRAVIHNDELTAGVLDLIDLNQNAWMSHEDIVGLMADMERIRHLIGIHPHRLTSIHGDYWTNNLYVDEKGSLISTDGRLVWGDPAIDIGWMIGEFIMQNFLRTGTFAGPYTQIAEEMVQRYQAQRNDSELEQIMALPYAFQTFAEAVFTPNLSDEQRRTILAVGRGALRARLMGEPFSFDRLDDYVNMGLQAMDQGELV